jgi:hypothetical protein
MIEVITTHRAYTLYNELYPDDEGFYKNNFYTQLTDDCQAITYTIPGTSSYTGFAEAVLAFRSYVESSL